MTQPTPDDRLAALEAGLAALQAALASWEPWRANATARFTALETTVTDGANRLAFLEGAAQGFATRVAAVEGKLATLTATASNVATRLAGLEGTVVDLQDAVSRVGQVARPGRTVIRERLDQLQDQVAEILKVVTPPPAEEPPPADPGTGTATT